MKKNLSAIKRTRISVRNRLRNKNYKVAIKGSIKKFLVNFSKTSNTTSSNYRLDELSDVYRNIDKAIKKGVIHKNKGSRQKSRLAQMVKKVSI